MSRVDMSAKAVTTRLKRVSQLRRLGLSLRKAKIKRRERTDKSYSDKADNPVLNEHDKDEKSESKSTRSLSERA